jgi:hypothetical protein
MPLTKGLLLCWLTNKSSSFVHLSSAAPADGMLSTFVLIFIIINLNGLQFRLTNIEFQHSSKPPTL